MNADMKEIQINGVEYVQKDSVAAPTLCDDYYIVRTYSAGVFAGEIVSRDGKECTMANARRLWYWQGAASLSQLAVEGTSKPSGCKFPIEVPEVQLTEVVEILRCTEMAQASIKSVPIWSA